jgi:hypothetical protein
MTRKLPNRFEIVVDLDVERTQAEQIAEKGGFQAALRAPTISLTLKLWWLARAYRQECLCHGRFSAACKALATGTHSETFALQLGSCYLFAAIC